MRIVWALAILAVLPAQVPAQGPGGPPARVPPKAAAPVDLTGYWVSLVTEDWRFRMVTPPKGDYTSIPLNQEGRKMADAWNPAEDGQCKAFGAAGIMRMPGRLHITWQGDDILKLETDAGTQTRLFPFAARQGASGDLQGVSVAAWDRPGSPMGFSLGLGSRGPTGGSLKVVTTKMKPGYLRKNGVPYSADAVMTEYFDRLDVPGGDSLLVVTTEMIDPAYLSQPFWTSTHFKKQADAAGWNPTPCAR